MTIRLPAEVHKQLMDDPVWRELMDTKILRRRTAHQDGEGVDPVVRVDLNPIPSCTGVIGWYQRAGYGPEEPWSEVRIGDASPWRIEIPEGLVCDESGA